MDEPLQASVPEPALDQVLAKAARGDNQAWRWLVEAYGKRVYGLLVRQCGDRELAQELTQATFVKIVGHLAGYQEQGKFEPWLFRIAMNKLRDEMRRRKRQARPMDMTTSRDEAASAWAASETQVVDGRENDADDPARHAQRHEEIAKVRAAIARLSASDQEILHLRHTAGLGFAEIAKTLKQPLGTVLARGHRALAKLKKLLQDEGGQDEP